MRTEILDARTEEPEGAIERAAALIAAGALVAFPTETVYGLGADALNPEAIAAVFAAKGRPSDNPLIVHVADPKELERCGRMSARAMLLARHFMPGPLTLVIPADPSIPDIARAGLPSVAVRVPDHPVARMLLARTGPLVAPSANRSGRPSPTVAAHVIEDLDGRIAAVLDGGPCRVGIESTVVDVTGDRAVILRPGIISRGQLERVLGEPVDISTGEEHAPRSPGVKYRHYAPAVPVRLVIAIEPPSIVPTSNTIVLTTRRHADHFTGHDVRPLSEATLYRLLREADLDRVDEIVIFAEPEELDAGLLDRVRKAAGA